MGTYLYANQYQNEIIPDGLQSFKREWFKYAKTLPDKLHTFAFIDPALSETDGADYTGCVVVSVDDDRNWYVRSANRYRINPTEIIELMFRLQKEYKPQIIGIEEVSFQKALLYMVDTEMRRRSTIIPVTGIKASTDKTKEKRIKALVPYFEWGRVYFCGQMYDLEMELTQFPRSSHDDLADALAYLEYIIYYPQKEIVRPKDLPVTHKDYERRYIESKTKSRHRRNPDSGAEF